MTNYIRDFTRVVLLSNDVLQTDIQRIELLQKVRMIKRIAYRSLTFLWKYLGTRTGKR